MPNQESKPLTVLVVDDDDIQRLMCCEALEAAGFKVLEANDGIPALEIFATQQVDLIILDVMMLELDGFETCRRIRQMPGGEYTPILMMTGLDDVESIDYAYRLGATDFVPKPINYAVLPRRVQYIHRATATAAELRESTRRLENAQRMASLGHWEWNSDTHRLLCSAETERLLNVKNNSVIALNDLFENVHADDRLETTKSLQIALQEQAPHQDTFRVISDNEVRFLHQDTEFFLR